MTLMRLPGIRLVEQTEQKFSRIRVCVKEKQQKSDCNSRAYIKAPTKNKKTIEMSVEETELNWEI